MGKIELHAISAENEPSFCSKPIFSVFFLDMLFLMHLWKLVFWWHIKCHPKELCLHSDVTICIIQFINSPKFSIGVSDGLKCAILLLMWLRGAGDTHQPNLYAIFYFFWLILLNDGAAFIYYLYNVVILHIYGKNK